MAFFKQVKNIQIEHSAMCNAACPQCLREWWGGDYSRINQVYLPLDFYVNNIPKEVWDGLEMIDFCGTVGDCCTAPNFIEVCRYIKTTHPHVKLSIASNGGMRNPAWWAELASVLTDNDFIIFGIDGMSNTNDVYRVNVRWNKLMDNVTAFIQAGGNAHWQFIVFEHNEHQIAEAEQLSKDMGFKRFFTIYNNRFAVEELFKRGPTYSKGIELRPPAAVQEQSIIIRRTNRIVEREEWLSAAEQGCIKCQSQENNEAYIDAEGHLLPCCYIAGAKFTLNKDDPDGYYDLWTKYGGDSINLNLHTWAEIDSSMFYQEMQNRWNKKFADGRLLVCSGTCSTEETQFSMYRNRKDD